MNIAAPVMDTECDRRYDGDSSRVRERSMPVVDIEFDRRTLVTSGRVRQTLPQSIRELAPEIDPQNWSTHSPYFEKSYKITRIHGAYERDRSAPAEGTLWQGYLFEHFR
jgi:hypothetical protein